MIRLYLISLVGLGFTVLINAAPLERDLGQGLVYIRVIKAPEDLPLSSQSPAIVLDLRYATGSGIKDWLETYAAPQTPILVLANSSTQKELRASVKGVAGSVTIGIAGEDFTPDITLDISAEEDQSAYDSVPQAPDIDSLLYPASNKKRYDEAAMTSEHSAEPSISVSSPEIVVETEQEKPPLIDQALLRAVQIHRGWIVLR